MGVNLSDIVTPKKLRMEALAGRVVAIDAFNTLYQFLAIIRQPDGTPLLDDAGRVTSHLSGIIYRLTNYLAIGIKPVFVFDGRPPPAKARTIAARQKVKVKAEREWKRALEAGDLPRARTKAMQTSRLTGEMIRQAEALLGALGVPVVHAPSEGEAQAAWMAAHGQADAAGSQDYDALLFGAPVLVKNMAITGRRKLPNKNVFVTVEPEEIRLDDVLRTLEVTREQLVDMALLIGTDFNEGVKGVGPKKARNLIRKHGTLEPALTTLDVTIENVDGLRRTFLEPNVDEAVTVAWGDPDREKVVSLLVDEHSFSQDRVGAALDKLEAAKGARSQSSLDRWG